MIFRKAQMMRMKRLPLVLLLGLVLGTMMGLPELAAQQFPISNHYTYRPWLYNPAIIFGDGQTNIQLIHQQRRTSFNGLSNSQFLNFRSAPQGMQNKMGWGVLVSNDFEHTEWRLNLLGQIGWHVINDTAFKDSTTIKRIVKLSVGGEAGLLNVGSNYNNIPVYDRQDDIISGASSFAELDAGIGVNYFMETPGSKIYAGATLKQLPGNALTKQRRALEIVPHLLTGGQYIYKTDLIWFGPAVLFKEVLGDSISIKDALLDATWMFQIPGKSNIWFGAGYRFNNVAVHGMAGVTVWSKLKETPYDIKNWGLDVTFGFEVPMNNTSIFGPSFELGVNYRFGKRDLNTLNTLVLEYRGPFWTDEANVNEHKFKELGSIVKGLSATADTSGNYVVLTYEFDDYLDQYAGEAWEGVEPFMKRFVEKVIMEALYPQALDSVQLEALRRVGKDPETWGTIASLEEIELACSLKVSKERVEFGDANIIYLGQWDTINGDLYNKQAKRRMLNSRIANDVVVYNDADTVLKIVPQTFVSNLELAYLKLISMRDIMLTELEQTGLDVTEREFMKMKITPDNPHQKAYQKMRIRLRFRKGRKAKAQSQGGRRR